MILNSGATNIYGIDPFAIGTTYEKNDVVYFSGYNVGATQTTCTEAQSGHYYYSGNASEIAAVANTPITPTSYVTGTATQSAQIVTGVGTTWEAWMVGMTFNFTGGSVSAGVITGFTSATKMTVTVSQTVTLAETYKVEGSNSWTQDFYFEPSYGASVNYDTSYYGIKYGDGYFNFLNRSENALKATFNVSFEKRTDKETKALLHFLDDSFNKGERPSGGYTGIKWTPFSPYDLEARFFVENFDHKYDSPDVNTVSTSFFNETKTLTDWKGFAVPWTATREQYNATGEAYYKHDAVFFQSSTVRESQVMTPLQSGWYYFTGDAPSTGISSDSYNSPTGEGALWTKDRFYFDVEAGLNIKQNPRFTKPQLQNDFYIRMKDGLNKNLLTFSLQMTGRTDVEAKAIIHFLEHHRGSDLIKFTLPAPYNFPDKVFICQRWNHSLNFKDNNDITIEFLEFPIDYLTTENEFNTLITVVNRPVLGSKGAISAQERPENNEFVENTGLSTYVATGFSIRTGFYLTNSGRHSLKTRIERNDAFKAFEFPSGISEPIPISPGENAFIPFYFNGIMDNISGPIAGTGPFNNGTYTTSLSITSITDEDGVADISGPITFGITGYVTGLGTGNPFRGIVDDNPGHPEKFLIKTGMYDTSSGYPRNFLAWRVPESGYYTTRYSIQNSEDNSNWTGVTYDNVNYRYITDTYGGATVQTNLYTGAMVPPSLIGEAGDGVDLKDPLNTGIRQPSSYMHTGFLGFDKDYYYRMRAEFQGVAGGPGYNSMWVYGSGTNDLNQIVSEDVETGLTAGSTTYTQDRIKIPTGPKHPLVIYLDNGETNINLSGKFDEALVNRNMVEQVAGIDTTSPATGIYMDNFTGVQYVLRGGIIVGAATTSQDVSVTLSSTLANAATTMSMNPVTTLLENGDVVKFGSYTTGTATQAVKTVTGVGTAWGAWMVGMTFNFTGTSASAGVITGFISTTEMTVTVSQTVTVAENYEVEDANTFTLGADASAGDTSIAGTAEVGSTLAVGTVGTCNTNLGAIENGYQLLTGISPTHATKPIKETPTLLIMKEGSAVVGKGGNGGDGGFTFVTTEKANAVDPNSPEMAYYVGAFTDPSEGERGGDAIRITHKDIAKFEIQKHYSAQILGGGGGGGAGDRLAEEQTFVLSVNGVSQGSTPTARNPNSTYFTNATSLVGRTLAPAETFFIGELGRGVAPPGLQAGVFTISSASASEIGGTHLGGIGGGGQGFSKGQRIVSKGGFSANWRGLRGEGVTITIEPDSKNNGTLLRVGAGGSRIDSVYRWKSSGGNGGIFGGSGETGWRDIGSNDPFSLDQGNQTGRLGGGPGKAIRILDYSGTAHYTPTNFRDKMLFIGPRFFDPSNIEGLVAQFDAQAIYDTGTATQLVKTVTGVGTKWEAWMVGSTFDFTGGAASAGVITGFTSATEMTVTVSQTVGVAQSYELSNVLDGSGAVIANNTGVGKWTSKNDPNVYLEQTTAGSTPIFFQAGGANQPSATASNPSPLNDTYFNSKNYVYFYPTAANAADYLKLVGATAKDITVDENATTGATSLKVASLGVGLASGTVIYFEKGSESTTSSKFVLSSSATASVSQVTLTGKLYTAGEAATAIVAKGTKGWTKLSSLMGGFEIFYMLYPDKWDLVCKDDGGSTTCGLVFAGGDGNLAPTYKTGFTRFSNLDSRHMSQYYGRETHLVQETMGLKGTDMFQFKDWGLSDNPDKLPVYRAWPYNLRARRTQDSLIYTSRTEGSSMGKEIFVGKTFSFMDEPIIGASQIDTNQQVGFHGAIAEILIYSRILTETERNCVTGYLMNKYLQIKTTQLGTRADLIRSKTNLYGLDGNGFAGPVYFK